jgi:TonB family protein
MSGPIISAGWEGRVIDGRFALHEWLGGSATSGVFRTDLPQPVAKKAAIKLIPTEGAEADAYVSGWAKAATLSNPHLMRVFRSGRYQFGSIGLAYVVVECADEVLSQILPMRALTSDETREMLGPVVEALGYLHEKGFVHGHLKPANILVVNDQVKISGDNITAGGMRNRFEPPSPYDAPEVGTGVLTPASDVWSLGITLVETLTQRTLAWDRTSSRDLAPPEEMPRTFAEIVRECLRRNPDERCSLEEIKARLEPNKPIVFPAKVEKASTAAEMAPVERTAIDESELPRPRIGILPLVLGLIAVVVIALVLLLRSSWKPSAPQSEPGPTATAPGSGPGTGPASNTAERASAVSVPAASPSDPASSPDRGASRVKGDAIERKMPVITPQARRTIHGTVTVAVRAAVDAQGTVSDVSFKSEGPSKYFAKAALEAARGWTFKPAEKNGEPVKSEWVLCFKFRQRGDEAAATEEKP